MVVYHLFQLIVYSFTNSQISRLDQIDDAGRGKRAWNELVMGWAPTPGAGALLYRRCGQFRGVGRLITLSQYDDIQKHLSNA